MKIPKRRRRENKTDYLKRLKLLKSGKPRIVFRKSNKYIYSQYVESKEAQDFVKLSVCSKELLNYGWPKELSGSLKSITASYLTGLLIGKKIIKEKLETPILDVGMMRVIRKNKIFAFLKGLIDSGIEMPFNEEYFPEEERIQGKELKEDFSKKFNEIKLKIEKI
jgi:large subunit ribosomal protein L18